METQKTQIAKAILSKKKVMLEVIIIPDIKLYYIATVTKIEWH
jgi:hypothetical protein